MHLNVTNSQTTTVIMRIDENEEYKAYTITECPILRRKIFLN